MRTSDGQTIHFPFIGAGCGKSGLKRPDFHADAQLHRATSVPPAACDMLFASLSRCIDGLWVSN